MKLIRRSFKWLWQLPQNLLAIFLTGVLYPFMSKGTIKLGNRVMYNSIFPSSFSLGDYIFMTLDSNDITLLHECGHSRQSDLLGPLYLVVIGIPSVLHCMVHYVCYKIGITWNYYSFYTESWANELVGIKKMVN